MKRICIKDTVIEDGDKTFELKRGKEYWTSRNYGENNEYCTVLSSFWAYNTSVDLFAGEIDA